MAAPPDPTALYATVALFAALLCVGAGIGIGIAIQAHSTNAEIEQLAAENRLLRKRLAHAICRWRLREQAVKRLEKYIDRNWYGEVGDVDEYLMQDRSVE